MLNKSLYQFLTYYYTFRFKNKNVLFISENYLFTFQFSRVQRRRFHCRTLQKVVNMLLRRNLIRVFTRNYAKVVPKKVYSALNDALIDRSDVINWGDIRNEMLKDFYSVNTTNIDALIISKCFNGARLDIAKSYIDYLKSNNMTVSDAFAIKFIRLFYTRYRSNKKEFTKKDFDELLEWCDMIINKFPILDTLTAENIVHGLSLTSKWREAERYFEMITDKIPDKSTYCAFISRAISEGDEMLAWKYLNEMAKQQQLPKTFIFTEWFEKFQSDKKKVDQMFEYISDNGLLIPEMDVKEFTQSLSKNYSSSIVTINRKGKCPSCTAQLPGVRLMDSEFKRIASTFLDDIIIKNDAFIKTNPKEIERYKTFVEKTIPFDCIIDGLNVAFSQGNRLSNAVYSKILAQTVKHFADQEQKCLVIGRKYMEGWPHKEMKFIKQNSKLFLVEDLYDFIFPSNNALY